LSNLGVRILFSQINIGIPHITIVIQDENIITLR